jgi:hypothetical protein
MRSTTILLVAAALGAAPAAAQNTTNDANTVAIGNEVVADPNMTATMPVNDVTTVPLEPPATVEEQDVEVTTERRGGFPWGLIGLIGLVGLLGRARS